MPIVCSNCPLPRYVYIDRKNAHSYTNELDDSMKRLMHLSIVRRAVVTACLLAMTLLFLFPATSEAHAILLRSDPPADAVLTAAPTQVHMWFSEDLNPTYSTAVVVNTSNKRVDLNDAQIATNDKREMDVSLQPDLPPAAYVVLWRTQSADDGHILRGSFIFKVEQLDGTIPGFNGTLPGRDALGGATSNSLATGQLDGSTGFLFVMVTLVDLGVVFWFGAQLWYTFVLQLIDSPDDEQQALYEQTERRFERRFALPALLLMLFANIGVLVGQALALTGGRFAQALSPRLLAGLVTTGQFGTFWIMREVVLLLAIVVALYTLLAKPTNSTNSWLASLLPWLNLILGLALLLAMVLSGHAAAVASNVVIYAVLNDWLHLLAASLWIGGMMYLATCYLPVLKHTPLMEQAKSLLTTLPRYTPLAIAGVLIMTLSGPFNATVHLTSWQQLLSTAYGRTLDIKVLLVGALLLTSAYHVGLLRPRLARSYQQYHASMDVDTDNERQKAGESKRAPKEGRGSRGVLGAVAQLVKSPESAVVQDTQQLQTTIDQQTQRLTRVLSYEPLLGVAVLLCTGLLTVFAGTLQPASQPPPALPVIKPYTTTVSTSDKQFTLNVKISPDRFGANIFTVTVMDSKGQPVPTDQVGVSLYTTMLDMDMGTSPGLNLQPDGKGHFTGTGDLDMPGHWQLRVQIRTLNNTLHEAKFDFTASA